MLYIKAYSPVTLDSMVKISLQYDGCVQNMTTHDTQGVRTYSWEVKGYWNLKKPTDPFITPKFWEYNYCADGGDVSISFLDETNKIISNYIIHTPNVIGNIIGRKPSSLELKDQPQSVANNVFKIIGHTHPHSQLSGYHDQYTLSIIKTQNENKLKKPVDDWQKQNKAKLSELSLNKSIFPGAHDASSFLVDKTISEKNYIFNSSESPLDSQLIKYSSPSYFKTVAAWSITQDLNFKEMLENGIRYFDLNLCSQNTNNIKSHEIEFCHASSTTKINTLISDLSTFLKNPKHDSEIIILDFNGPNDNIDPIELNNFVEKFTKSPFSTKIAAPFNEKDPLSVPKKFLPSSTFSELWEQKKQIILNWKLGDSPIFWNNKINSYWPNTSGKDDISSKTDAFLNMVKENLVDKNYNKSEFFIVQTHFTPDTKIIDDGMFKFWDINNPESLIELLPSYKSKIYEWLRDSETQKNLNEKGGIITEDFTNGVDLTHLVIDILNKFSTVTNKIPVTKNSNI